MEKVFVTEAGENEGKMTYFDPETKGKSPKKISFKGIILYSEGGYTHHLRIEDRRFQNDGSTRFCLRRLLEKYKAGDEIKITIEKLEVKK